MTEEQRDDYVLNQGVKKLVRMDEDFKYTGHPVTAVAGYTNQDDVEVRGEFVDNSSFPTEQYLAYRSLMTSHLSAESIRKKNPKFLKFVKWAARHWDRSKYFFCIRYFFQD